MQEEKTHTNFLGYLAQLMDRFTGDKVIFLIALFLAWHFCEGIRMFGGRVVNKLS